MMYKCIIINTSKSGFEELKIILENKSYFSGFVILKINECRQETLTRKKFLLKEHILSNYRL